MIQSKKRLISTALLTAMLFDSIAIPTRAMAQNRDNMSNFGLSSLFGNTSSSSNFRSGSGLYGNTSVLCDDLLYAPDYDIISPEDDSAILDAKLRLQIERGLMKYVFTYDKHGVDFALKLTNVKDNNKPDLALFLQEMKFDHSRPVKEIILIVGAKIEEEYRAWLKSRLPKPDPEPTGILEPTPIAQPSTDPILDDSNPNLGYTVPRVLNREEIEKMNELTKKYLVDNPEVEVALAKRAAIKQAELADSRIVISNQELESLAKELGFAHFSDMSPDDQAISAFQVKRGKMNKIQRFFFKSKVVASLFRAMKMSDGKLLGFMTKKGRTYSLRDHKKFLLINRDMDTLTSYWQMHELLHVLSQNENLKAIVDLHETPEVRPEVVLFEQGGMRVETLIQNIKDKIYYQSTSDPSSGSSLNVNTGGGSSTSDIFGSNSNTSTSPNWGNDPTSTSTGLDTGTQTTPSVNNTTINIKIPGAGGADPKQFQLNRAAAGVNDVYFEALTRMLKAKKRLQDLGGRGRGDPGRISEVEGTYNAALAMLDKQVEFYNQAKAKKAAKKVLLEIKEKINHQKRIVDRLSRELAIYYSDFIESFLLYKMYANVNSGKLVIFDEIEDIRAIKFPEFAFVKNKDLIKQWNAVFDRALGGGGTDSLARGELKSFFKDFYNLATRKFIRRIDDLMNNQIGVRYADTPSGQQLQYMIKRSYIEMGTLFAKFVWKVFSITSRTTKLRADAGANQTGTTAGGTAGSGGNAAGAQNGAQNDVQVGGDFGLPDENTLQKQKDETALGNAVRNTAANAVDAVFWTAVTGTLTGNAEAWTKAILHLLGLGG